ncbi:MAG: mechanosensitive ion channel family protein [Halodesulfurarchaeum sp.]
MMQVIELDWAGLFSGEAGIDTRLLISAAIIVIGIIVSHWLVPFAMRKVTRMARWAVSLIRYDPIAGSVTNLSNRTQFTLHLIRLVRLLVFVVIGIGLVAVWGELETIFTWVQNVHLPMSTIVKTIVTVLLVIGAYSGMGILRNWVDQATSQSERISAHQEEITLRVLQIILLITTSIILLTMWGVDLGGLLVGAGFLGIVAGLAAQQTLGSLIAGFVLMLSRPFEIGDWVEIGEHEGIVSEVTIVNTRLENFDGELIVLPNDSVGNATIINRSKKGRLRLRVEVGIDYDADPERAMEVAREALVDVEQILTVPRPRVVTQRMADSAIVLEMRFWIDKPSARRRALAVTGAIKAVSDAFEEEEIKIPFPQRELSERGETGGFRVIRDSIEED